MSAAGPAHDVIVIGAGPAGLATSAALARAGIASGIVANPYEPAIPQRHQFRGRVLHSVDYRRPEAFAGERVLIVGAGNSAGEISVELAHADEQVTLAVRTGAIVVPREVAGIPIQYVGLALGALPTSGQRLAVAAMRQVAALLHGRAALPAPPRNACPRVPLIGLRRPAMCARASSPSRAARPRSRRAACGSMTTRNCRSTR